VRRVPLGGRGPSGSTRLRERRCSQSERREAVEGRREREAAHRLAATPPAQRPKSQSSTRPRERHCSQSERAQGGRGP
jgi:hypothetical protein